MYKVYKTTITNPKTGESSVRYCQTSEGFAYVVSKAIESVEKDTITAYLPDSWEITTEIIAQ